MRAHDDDVQAVEGVGGSLTLTSTLKQDSLCSRLENLTSVQIDPRLSGAALAGDAEQGVLHHLILEMGVHRGMKGVHGLVLVAQVALIFVVTDPQARFFVGGACAFSVGEFETWRRRRGATLAGKCYRCALRAQRRAPFPRRIGREYTRSRASRVCRLSMHWCARAR